MTKDTELPQIPQGENPQQENDPQWKSGVIDLGKGKIASYEQSGKGIYFFRVNTADGDTIGNYVDAAKKLSSSKGSEVKFYFSSRCVIIDASDPEAQVSFEVPEDDNWWLGELVEEHLNRPSVQEREQFTRDWFSIDKDDVVGNLLQYLVKTKSRSPYDNPLKFEDNVEGILHTAWNIRDFKDIIQKDQDIKIAEEIRGLAWKFYQEAVEKAAYFIDPDDALECTLQVLYGLAHSNTD